MAPLRSAQERGLDPSGHATGPVGVPTKRGSRKMCAVHECIYTLVRYVYMYMSVYIYCIYIYILYITGNSISQQMDLAK